MQLKEHVWMSGEAQGRVSYLQQKQFSGGFEARDSMEAIHNIIISTEVIFIQ